MFGNATVKFILTFFVPFFVVAQVEYTGFLGGPLHGTVKDEKEAVTVQLGLTADLIVPNGFAAHSEQSRLSSGSSTALHASLLLDDDSHTVLNPESVEWTLSQPVLQVRSGSLLAEVLSESTMVRVRISAEGFSTSLTEFILADDKEISKKESDSLPEALRSAIELEAVGWKESEWFGVFYDVRNGWVYHADHEWIHLAEGGGEPLGSGMNKTNGDEQVKVFTPIFIAIAMLLGCTFLNKDLQRLSFTTIQLKNSKDLPGNKKYEIGFC
jgi:hypothetical protein